MTHCIPLVTAGCGPYRGGPAAAVLTGMRPQLIRSAPQYPVECAVCYLKAVGVTADRETAVRGGDAKKSGEMRSVTADSGTAPRTDLVGIGCANDPSTRPHFRRPLERPDAWHLR